MPVQQFNQPYQQEECLRILLFPLHKKIRFFAGLTAALRIINVLPTHNADASVSIPAFIAGTPD
jgi:hypothetical protein